MTELRESLVDERIRVLGRVAAEHESMAIRLLDHVRKGMPEEALRMNPHVLAGTLGLEPAQVTDAMVAMTRAELLVMEWNLVCPICGGIENHHSLGEINKHEHFCGLCRVGTAVDLSGDVEVVFSVNPDLPVDPFDPYRDVETYMGHFFSRSLVRPPQVEQFMREAVRTFLVLKPGQTARLRLRQVRPGIQYTLISLDRQMSMVIQVDPEQDASVPRIVDLELGEHGMEPAEVRVPAGEVLLNLRHVGGQRMGLILLARDLARAKELFAAHRISFVPRFTGLQLLSNQSFLDLFRAEHLPPNLHIQASSINIVFTDLKGSTELYEKSGDLRAYSLVQEHFDLLKTVVDRYGGALIKTIGDAVMAAFPDTRDSLAAAFDMVKAIREMNRRTSAQGHEIAIKVGLHHGNALAVNANDRLDYFGQTVNLAARIQGLAAGGEIWISKDVFEAKGIQEDLERRRATARKHDAELKGVSRLTTVYGIVPA